MAKEPAARYQKAAELRNALADFVDGSRAPAADAAIATRGSESRAATVPSRKRALSGRAMVAIVTGAVAILVLAAALRRDRAVPPPPMVETPAPVMAVQPVTPAPPVEPQLTPTAEAVAAAALAESQAAASEGRKSPQGRATAGTGVATARRHRGAGRDAVGGDQRRRQLARRVTAADATDVAAGRAYDRDSQRLGGTVRRARRDQIG